MNQTALKDEIFKSNRVFHFDLNEIASITIHDGNHNFEINIGELIVTFYNTINPKDAWKRYNRECFEKRAVSIDKARLDIICKLIREISEKHGLETNGRILYLLQYDGGCGYDVEMAINLGKKEVIYYINASQHENDYSQFEREPIPKEFNHIIDALNEICSFPPLCSIDDFL